jgi:hypothetical protein
MSESNRDLLTIAAVIISVVVAIVLYVAGVIDWTLIVPVVLLLSGLWLFALGVLRMIKPVRYERSPFSTIAMGLVVVAVGGAWALFSINWLYSLIVILVAVAGLAIATAARQRR